MGSIFKLKITLVGSKPTIWRKVLVKNTTTFEQLHYTIQIVMGWENYHLYDFDVKNYKISEPEDDDFASFSRVERVDSSKLKLKDIVFEENEKFKYTYDFGDNWVHQIEVEKILPREKGLTYPICVDGKNNCPPEDCGGIPGFYYLLDVINNVKHPEREERLEWLGRPYDPKFFDIEAINLELNKFMGVS